jgi:undecaprenyl-diphosphatase
MKGKRKNLYVAIGSLIGFILWTVAVRFIDVRAIGPEGSSVGFAALNGAVRDFTGAHMWLYTLTDILGLIPIATAFGFAVFGLIQWIGRKSILRVDRNILALGGFYIAVIVAYLLFELVAVNYRPVLIEGILEVSYPSSTTMLVICVMSTAAIQLNGRIKSVILRRCVMCAIIVFIVFMVAGRLFSGVHWFTDIVGGAILSAGLIELYRFFE